MLWMVRRQQERKQILKYQNYDQRLDGDGSMTFKEFKEHIADSGYTAPDNYMITIDRGKVYLIQLFD